VDFNHPRRLADPYHYQSFQHLLKWRITFLFGTLATLTAVAWVAFAKLKGFPAWRLFFGHLSLLLTCAAILAAQRALYDWGVWRYPDHEGWLALPALAVFICGLCAPAALVAAVLRDLAGRGMPWTHWLGVGVFVLQISVSVLNAVWVYGDLTLS
jgi:hypothetical protein